MKKEINYLMLALQQAKLSAGCCAPTPSVGAVVVKDNELLAVGHHQGPFTAHAERAALRQLSKDQSEGATLYVTLEPCCHHGRTPPCTDLIIKYRLARVVFAYCDPNPQVAGQGVQQLRNAGIKCKQFALKEIDDFYQGYHYWWQHKKPFITAQIALSLDNKSASANAVPAVITEGQVNQFAHLQRQQSDCLLMTINTILADNPRLNTRLSDTVTAKPVAIIDRNLQLPLTANLIQSAGRLFLFYDKNNRQEEALQALTSADVI